MNRLISGIPLFYPTGAFILAIVLSYYLGSWFILTFAIIIGCFCFIFKFRYLSIILVSVCFGALCVLLNLSNTSYLPENRPVLISADILNVKENNSGQTVVSEVIGFSLDNGTHFTKVEPIKVMFSVPSLIPPLKAGYNIVVNTTFEQPDYKTYVPDQFSFAKNLERKGFKYHSFLLPDSIKSVMLSDKFSMQLKRLRNNISDIILRTTLQPSAKLFLNTIITGDTNYIDLDIRQAFTLTGVAHLLALSGLHVGIISAFLFVIFYPLRLTRINRFTPLIIILFLWFFALLTGMSPSVTRAVIMATVFLCALLLQRTHNPLNSLCLAAIIILTFEPHAIFDISFQLSFLSVLGILVFYRKLNPINPRRKILYYFVGIFAVSISAMAFAGIVSAYHFHSFPIYFLITNAIISPIIPLFVSFGIIFIIFSIIGIEPYWLIKIIDWLYIPIEKIPIFFSTLPGGNIQNLYFDGIILSVGILFILSIALILYYKRPATYFASFLILISIIFLIGIHTNPNANELYLVPYKTRTDLLLSNSNKLFVITNAPKSEHLKIKHNISQYFKDYTRRRNIDSIFIKSEDFSTDNIEFSSSIITLPKGNIAFCSSNDFINRQLFPDNIKYLIISRGYTGELENLLEYCAADTVVLCSDLHPLRHERYLAYCQQLKRPVISLKESMPPSLLHLLK